MAGSFVSGALVDRLGDRNATRIALGVALLGTLALAVIVSPALAWPLVALFGLAYGTYQTVYFALAMEHTDPRIAASMFSILMAVTNVAQGVGMGVSGALGGRHRLPRHLPGHRGAQRLGDPADATGLREAGYIGDRRTDHRVLVF